MFMLSSVGSYATEGSGFSFDVTPESALSVDKRIRWEIIFRGDIPAFSSDFISMSGDLGFVSGATASQTITLSIADDNFYEIDREFVIRVWDTNNTADDISDDTRIGEDAVVILQDDDTNNFTNSVNAFTGLGDNTFTAASSIFLNFVSANGDDSFIITRFQYGDVRINDTAGSSYIKFDRGVTIEAINEEVVSFGGREVTSVDLILSTGSTITIEAPTKPEFQYQLGDSRVLDYGDFISTLGTVSASLPYVVTGSSTVATPDDGFRNVIGLYRTVGDDIMGLGSDFDLNVTGGLGDDSFIITRFQTGDVRIKDVAGSSYIKFDRGVTIVSVYEEVVSFGGREVTSVDLILSTGSTINIDAPTKPEFQYQFGDGDLLNYEDFVSALSSVVVSVAGDVSSDRYVVGGVIFGAGPYHHSVSENLDASGVGNAMVLGSISATVTSGETLNYAFDGGTLTDSLGHFAITSVGEISYIGSGLDRETTSVHYLKVQATSSDGSVDVANISIEVDNVNEVPVLLSMIGRQTVTTGVDLDVSSFFGDVDVASSGDELTYTAMRVDSGGVNPTALPSGLSINADTGIFSASTSAVAGVTHQVEVTATDSGGLSVVSNVFALYVNTAPVVSNSIDDETFALGVADSITIADSNDTTSNVFSDVDGDALTYTATFSDGSSLSGGITFVTSNGVTQLIFDSSVVAGVYDFSITTTDIHGASGVESFSVTVNTPPQFSSPDAITFTNTDSTVTEDDSTDNRVSGALSFSDVDSGDTLADISLHATNDGTAPTASIGELTFTSGEASIVGTYGTFTFMRDATTSAVTWMYDLDNADSDTNVLGSGVSVTESVQLLVRDDDNAVSSVVTLSVTVEGSNDAPVAQNPIDDEIFDPGEAGTITIANSSNTMSNVFSDPEGDTLTYMLQIEDAMGTFVDTLPSGITWDNTTGDEALIFADTVALGVYNFLLTATDSQNSGTDTFSVTVSTAPVFSSTNAITNNNDTVTEDDSTDFSVSGDLNYSDVDSGDTLATLSMHATTTVTEGDLDKRYPLANSIDGVYGAFTFVLNTVAPAAAWIYVLDNSDPDTNALGSGDSVTDSVQLVVRDTRDVLSSVETLTVNVTGSNDAPVLSNPIIDKIFTPGVSNFTFADDVFSDVDTGDTLTYTAMLTNGLALPMGLSFTPSTRTFNIATTLDVGIYTIRVTAEDSESLSATDTFSVTVSTAPVVANSIDDETTFAFEEEGRITIADSSDIMSNVFSDADTGDTLTYTVMLVVVDPTDSTRTILTDPPSGIRVSTETTSGVTTTTLVISDTVATGDYDLEVKATDPQGLSVTDTFSVTVNTTPVVVTGNEIDDMIYDPGVARTITIADSNDTTSNVFSDADGDALTYTLEIEDATGTFVNIDTSPSPLPSGVTWSDNVTTTLVFSDTVALGVYNFRVTATDMTHDLSVTEAFSVTVSTAPVFSSTSAITNNNSTVTEDDLTNNSVTGDLNYSDVDSGDTLVTLSLHATNDGTAPTASTGLLTFTSGEASIGGTYGTFTFMRDATTSAVTWTYDLDNADPDTNALGSGDSVTESVQLLVRDTLGVVSPTVETLSVTVVGSNDAPVLSNAIGNKIFPLGVSNFAFAQDTFTDADTGDTLAYTALLVNADGSVSSLPTGLSFTPSTRTFDIATTLVLGIYTIRVTATDLQNLSVTDTFSITVSADPVIVNPIIDRIFAPNISDSIMIADSSDTASNVFTDPDGGTLSYLLKIEDAMGTFVDTLPSGITWDNTMGDEALIFSDTVALGVYNFQLTATDLDSLYVTEAFSVTVSTAPRFASTDAVTNNNATVTEDDGSPNDRVSGMLSFSDVDSDDTFSNLSLHVEVGAVDPTISTAKLTFDASTGVSQDVVGVYGRFTFTRDVINSTMTWTYVLDNTDSDTNALDVGDSVTESVRLLVSDTRDVVSPTVETLSVTVVGSNDAPVIAESGTAMAITEGVLTSDESTGITISVSDIENDTLSLSVVGDTRFELNASNELVAQSGAIFDYEPLTNGTLSVTIRAEDDNDSTSYSEVMVNVVIGDGNDAPVVANAISDRVIAFGNTGEVVIADSSDTASNVFSDENSGDTLTYTATLSDGSSLPSGVELVTASGVTKLSFDDTVAGGLYTFVVTVTDNGTDRANQFITEEFDVKINRSPVVANTLDDQFFAPGSASGYIVPVGTFTDADVEDTLSYTAMLVDPTDSSNLIDLPSSGISFNPNLREFIIASTVSVGFYTIRLTATDGNASSQLDLNIVVNTAPRVNVSMNIPNEEGVVGVADSFTFAVDAFSDDEGDTLTYTAMLVNADDSVSSLPTGLSFEDTTPRTFNIATGLARGVYTIRVTAYDYASRPNKVSQDFTLDMNTAPVVGNAIEDKILTLGVSNFTFAQDTFTDADTEDTLAYTALLVDPNDSSNLIALPTGLSFTPSTRTFDIATGLVVGTYTIRVTATDPQGLSVTDDFILVVNTDPVVANAIDDVVVRTGEEDVVSFATDVFTDADVEDTLSYTAMLVDPTDSTNLIDLPTGISFNPNLREFTIASTVLADTYTIQVTATDSRNGKATDNFDLVVNSLPVLDNAITNQSLTLMTTDQTFVIPANTFSDPENDTLTYTAQLVSSDGTVSDLMTTTTTAILTFEDTTTNPRTFTIVASTATAGGYVIRMKASDAHGFVEEDFFLALSDITGVATFSGSTSFTVDENTARGTAIGTMSATLTGFTPTYGLVGGGNVFSIDATTGVITITATSPASSSPLDYEDISTYSLAIEATANSKTATQIITVGINDVNEAPVVANAIDDLVIDINQEGTFTFADDVFSDPDAGDETLTYTALLVDPNDSSNLIALPTGLSFTPSTRTFTVPTTVTVGTYEIRVTAQDDDPTTPLTASDEFDLRVTHAPVFASAAVTGSVTENALGETFSATLTATDADSGDTIAYTVTQNSTYGTSMIDSSTGVWTYELNNSHMAVNALNDSETLADSFTITAIDSLGATATKEITITINGLTDVVGTNADDTLDQSAVTVAQIIQGGTGEDIVTAGSGGDIIVGGLDNDTITLGSGDDTIVYRYNSAPVEDDGTVITNAFQGYDGGDTINNFARGRDKLVFVDTVSSGSISEASFFDGFDQSSSPNGGTIRFILDARDVSGTSTTFVSGMEVIFEAVGSGNSTIGSQTALKLTINFTEATQFELTNSSDANILGGISNISTNSDDILDPSAMVTIDSVDYSVFESLLGASGSFDSFDLYSSENDINLDIM